VHSNACSDCVVEKTSTAQDETTAGADRETIQVAVDDALQGTYCSFTSTYTLTSNYSPPLTSIEFLDACKDGLGIDLTVSNTSATETLGPVAAAIATTAALPTSTSTSGAPSAMYSLAHSAALFLVASTLIFLNI
jgi:hypothetical protein